MNENSCIYFSNGKKIQICTSQANEQSVSLIEMINSQGIPSEHYQHLLQLCYQKILCVVFCSFFAQCFPLGLIFVRYEVFNMTIVLLLQVS